MNNVEVELLRMTKQIMNEFYHSNPGPLTDALHKNVVWIGKGDFLHGIPEAAEDIKRESCVQREMRSSSYHVVCSTHITCLITGKFLLSEKRAEGGELLEEQRGSFFWENCRGVWKLRHIHMSNPALKKKPSSSGCIAARKNIPLYVKDCRKGDIFLEERNVMYMEAMEGIVTFYLRRGNSVVTRESMNGLEQRLPCQFIRIHRSYIVNMEYVNRIKRYHLYLKDGQELPIPEKKYNLVKKRILEMKGNI